MTLRIFLSIVSFIICLNSSAQAHSSTYAKCQVTKEYKNNYEPESFYKSNNLLRLPGKTNANCGEVIIISGRVLDVACVPVGDAKVYLWQVGCDGLYNYKPLRSLADKALINTSSNQSFLGSGVATTNNLGEFNFITILPRSQHDLPPHVNLRVEHRILGNIQTRIILNDHQQKAKKKLFTVELVLPIKGNDEY
jgi:protocatechuate 3,4-dioxygenase beta subunit